MTGPRRLIGNFKLQTSNLQVSTPNSEFEVRTSKFEVSLWSRSYTPTENLLGGGQLRCRSRTRGGKTCVKSLWRVNFGDTGSSKPIGSHTSCGDTHDPIGTSRARPRP